ncbi:uncharacterized protein LOC141902141 [Tubulanus polymorphus]|uniref:uncharacterized protein LOC141902141 n=1 Tax=Tubulanus polymorphus TaxID=672921 RepID=UPI003DA52A80
MMERNETGGKSSTGTDGKTSRPTAEASYIETKSKERNETGGNLSTGTDGKTSRPTAEASNIETKSKGNKNCCVPLCHKAGYLIEKGEKVTFHRFPKDENLRRQWIIKIKRDPGDNFKIKDHTFVCSRHFLPEDIEFNVYNQRRYLRRGAVPSVFECWKDFQNIGQQSQKKSRKQPTQRLLDFRNMDAPPEEIATQSPVHEPVTDPLVEITTGEN